MLREELKHIKSDRKELGKFGLTVGIALVIFGGIVFWSGKSYYWYLIFTGLGLMAAGLLSPAILKPLQKVWMAAAITIGWFMSRVIIVVIFYLVLTPIAFIARLSGKRFLELKWDKSQPTYWNYRKVGISDKNRYEKQF
jgi:hypothetical protein